MELSSKIDAGQFLTFRLDGEIYALDIDRVREVLDLTEITRVPRTPEFVLGVINLRGGVVPVVDLRVQLGFSRADRTVDTCIIIIETIIDDEKTPLGVLVDSVDEVIRFDEGRIGPPPRLGMRLKTDFIKGMGKKDNDEFTIILDPDQVFREEELTRMPGGEKDNSSLTTE